MENGKPFLTRGRVYNILRKIEKFVKFGDIALQHHPDVVALVWASVRMLLQVCDPVYRILLQVARASHKSPKIRIDNDPVGRAERFNDV